jgi:hypothetical protein
MPVISSLLVDRGDLHHTEVVEEAVDDATTPPDGSVLLAVERFGCSANNVTYAVFGDAMAYWSAFPGPDGWGRVPAWGLARVERSAQPDVAEGSRFYGLVPMASHLVVRPEAVSATGFSDGAEHRRTLAGVYRRYVELSADPLHRDRTEDLEVLLRPLFTTSFLLDDHLADERWFGADAVVITSASSRTALGLAHLLHERPDPRPAVVGLTSPSNLAHVRALGCYDRVLPYADAGALPVGPTALVDLAGDGRVVAAVHGHLADALVWSGVVGDTHWDAPPGPDDPLPGPGRTFFFAPDHVERRRADWGPGGLEARFAEAWTTFVDRAAEWITVVRGNGPDAVRRVFEETVRGDASPAVGHVLSFVGDDYGHLTD